MQEKSWRAQIDFQQIPFHPIRFSNTTITGHHGYYSNRGEFYIFFYTSSCSSHFQKNRTKNCGIIKETMLDSYLNYSTSSNNFYSIPEFHAPKFENSNEFEESASARTINAFSFQLPLSPFLNTIYKKGVSQKSSHILS